MKIRTYLVLGFMLPLLSLGQIHYQGSSTHYPDVTVTGITGQWMYSGSNTQAYAGSAGVYAFTINASTSSIPHQTITVAVNNLTVATLTAGNNFASGFVYMNKGFNSLDIGANFTGPYASCVTGSYRIEMYGLTGQFIDDHTVTVSTVSPNQIVLPATNVNSPDHWFQSYARVNAGQRITLKPGMNIAPIPNYFGPIKREFRIRPCTTASSKSGDVASNQAGEESGAFPFSAEEIPEVRIVQNPVSDQLRLVLLNENQSVPFQVFSLDGKVVLNEQLQPGENSFSVQHLPSGMYVIQSNVGNQLSRDRVVIQH